MPCGVTMACEVVKCVKDSGPKINVPILARKKKLKKKKEKAVSSSK